MSQRLRSLLLAMLLIATPAAFCPVAWAGPFEDATEAYKKGDYATALGLLKPLAEQGDARSQFNLGVMYEKGQGVPQAYAEAVVWYRKAAEQGHALAQNNLGLMYGKGQGVRQDKIMAHMWLNLASTRLNATRAQQAASARDNLAKQMKPEDVAKAQKLAAEWKPTTKS